MNAESATRWARAKAWIIDHDDSKLFLVLYVGLAVVLSLWISLFWLVAVVAVHGLLEWIRQHHLDKKLAGVVARVMWEIKLDIALILFAMALDVYLDFILGLAGLQAVARGGQAAARGGQAATRGGQAAVRGGQAAVRGGQAAARGAQAAARGGQMAARGTQAAARFAGWQRVIRGVFLTLDDVAQVIKGVFTRKQRAKLKKQNMIAGKEVDGVRGDVKAGDDSATADAGAERVETREEEKEKQEKKEKKEKPFSIYEGWDGKWGVVDWISIGLGGVCLVLILVAPWVLSMSPSEVLHVIAEELQPFPRG